MALGSLATASASRRLPRRSVAVAQKIRTTLPVGDQQIVESTAVQDGGCNSGRYGGCASACSSEGDWRRARLRKSSGLCAALIQQDGHGVIKFVDHRQIQQAAILQISGHQRHRPGAHVIGGARKRIGRTTRVSCQTAANASGKQGKRYGKTVAHKKGCWLVVLRDQQNITNDLYYNQSVQKLRRGTG